MRFPLTPTGGRRENDDGRERRRKVGQVAHEHRRVRLDGRINVRVEGNHRDRRRKLVSSLYGGDQSVLDQVPVRSDGNEVAGLYHLGGGLQRARLG